MSKLILLLLSVALMMTACDAAIEKKYTIAVTTGRKTVWHYCDHRAWQDNGDFKMWDCLVGDHELTIKQPLANDIIITVTEN